MREETIKSTLLRIIEEISVVGSIGGKGSNIWRDVNRMIQEKKQQKPF